MINVIVISPRPHKLDLFSNYEKREIDTRQLLKTSSGPITGKNAKCLAY